MSRYTPPPGGGSGAAVLGNTTWQVWGYAELSLDANPEYTDLSLGAPLNPSFYGVEYGIYLVTMQLGYLPGDADPLIVGAVSAQVKGVQPAASTYFDDTAVVYGTIANPATDGLLVPNISNFTGVSIDYTSDGFDPDDFQLVSYQSVDHQANSLIYVSVKIQQIGTTS